MPQFLFIEFPMNQLSDGNMVESLRRSTTSILTSIYKEMFDKHLYVYQTYNLIIKMGTSECLNIHLDIVKQ